MSAGLQNYVGRLRAFTRSSAKQTEIEDTIARHRRCPCRRQRPSGLLPPVGRAGHPETTTPAPSGSPISRSTQPRSTQPQQDVGSPPAGQRQQSGAHTAPQVAPGASAHPAAPATLQPQQGPSPGFKTRQSASRDWFALSGRFQRTAASPKNACGLAASRCGAAQLELRDSPNSRHRRDTPHDTKQHATRIDRWRRSAA